MKAPQSPDLLARAYATLGLAVGASARDAARQHKRLVKRWHPDRYAQDPQGQAEANLRLREINRAYDVIRESAYSDFTRQPPVDAATMAAEPKQPRTRYFGQRLSASDVQEIADAIGAPGIVEAIARYFFWGGCIAAGLLLFGYGGRSGPRTPRRVEVLTGILCFCIVAISILRRLLFRSR